MSIYRAPIFRFATINEPEGKKEEIADIDPQVKRQIEVKNMIGSMNPEQENCFQQINKILAFTDKPGIKGLSEYDIKDHI